MRENKTALLQGFRVGINYMAKKPIKTINKENPRSNYYIPWTVTLILHKRTNACDE